MDLEEATHGEGPELVEVARLSGGVGVADGAQVDPGVVDDDVEMTEEVVGARDDGIDARLETDVGL